MGLDLELSPYLWTWLPPALSIAFVRLGGLMGDRFSWLKPWALFGLTVAGVGACVLVTPELTAARDLLGQAIIAYLIATGAYTFSKPAELIPLGKSPAAKAIVSGVLAVAGAYLLTAALTGGALAQDPGTATAAIPAAPAPPDAEVGWPTLVLWIAGTVLARLFRGRQR